MSKIIIVGKLDKAAEELYKCLNAYYEVHFSTDVKDLQNMLRIVKPELAILNLESFEEFSPETAKKAGILSMNIPLMILGKKENCNEYSPYFKEKKIVPVYRPVGTGEIVEKCRELIPEEQLPVQDMPKVKEEGPKSILVVDDSAVTLRSVKSLLDPKYRVYVAPSAEMALHIMEKTVPDMILLDYEMPVCDGKQTLEMIKQDERLKEIPVIFLTGVTDKERIASILKLRPAGYLLKPTEKDTLLGRIEEVFQNFNK